MTTDTAPTEGAAAPGRRLAGMPAIERIRARLHAADEAALRNRLRLQLQPWYAAAAVVGLGLVQELAQWVGASPGATATANALAISTTLGALAAIGRGRYSEIRDWLRAHPLRGTAAGAASWGWLVAASLADWADAAGLAQAGVVALVVLAAHWWRTHRPGHTITERVEPDLDVEEGPTGVAAQIAAEWQSSVVPRGGAYTNTFLSDYVKLDFAHEWTINFDGRHGQGAASVSVEEIAFALDKDPTTLIVEPHPDSQRRALLRWVESSPVIGHVTPEPEYPFAIGGRPLWRWEEQGRYPEGRATIGLYGDGVGAHDWLTYRSGRMFGGFVYGGTGAGKGILLALLQLAWRASGVTAVWTLDGSEAGDSYKGDLVDYADWDRTHGPGQARQALEAAYALMCDRGLGTRKGEFIPTPEDPGLVLILDECHNLLTNDENRDYPPGDFRRWSNTKLASEIARRGGKCGVVVVLATQDATLKAFGGDNVLRNSILQGNCLIMRGEKGAASLLNAKVNAAALQSGGGYAYAVATTDESGKEISRAAVLRCGYIHHDDYPHYFGQLGDVRLGGAARRIVDDYTAGDYSAAAETSVAEIKQQEDARREAYLRGEMALEEYLPHLFGLGRPPLRRRPPPGAGAGPRRPAPGLYARHHRVPGGGARGRRHRPSAARTRAPPRPQPPRAVPGRLQGAQAAVYAAVAAGAHTTAEVLTALEGRYSPSAIKGALKALAEGGDLVKAGHGRYTLPALDRAG
ncbi:type IV secretory system conjugative DNA transfer family protein [Nocardiopsis composta]